jgi:formate hydrogenlyase subunit 3/multisubunit Na+/H+ antiporter MnhD subunit
VPPSVGFLASFLIAWDYCSAHNGTSKAVQWIIIVVTTLVTIVSMRYVKARQAAVVQEIVFERRKRRQKNSMASISV